MMMTTHRTIWAFVAATALAPAAWGESTGRGTIDYVRAIDSVREYAKPKSIWGKLLEVVAGPAEDVPRLVRPYGVTTDSLGRLLVTDPGQKVVHIFDFEKRKYSYLKGGKKEPFESPIGVATAAADNVYVTDSARARILVFDKNGKFLRGIGGPDGGVKLLRPTGIAYEKRRRLLYVTDTLRHQVLVLGLDGSLVSAIGRRGTAQGEFNFPTALSLTGEALYVVDAMNFRIQSFGLDGRFQGSFGKLGDSNGTLNRPKGVAADSDGNLYVVDALFETVQIFNMQGQLLYFFGSTGSGLGGFVLPSGIYIDPRDRIYVADSYNKRIQIFRYRKVGQQ